MEGLSVAKVNLISLMQQVEGLVYFGSDKDCELIFDVSYNFAKVLFEKDKNQSLLSGISKNEEGEKKLVFPIELPVLINRYSGKPVEYLCQWSQVKQVLSVDKLVELYRYSSVDLVNQFDVENGVLFEAESIEASRPGEYLIKWKGYPQDFSTWEFDDDERWDREDFTGEKKQNLIKKWEENK